MAYLNQHPRQPRGYNAGNNRNDDSVVGNGTQPGTDYEMSDTDDDGLSDEYEIGIGTDPNNPVVTSTRYLMEPKQILAFM